MYARIGRIGVLLALVLLVVPGTTSHAQASTLAISLEPPIGPPGTSVTVLGHGAPANARVRLLATPFTATIGCDARRGADPLAEVQADSRGSFVAVHVAARASVDHTGYTYRAVLIDDPAVTSNLACFTFGGPASRFFPETGQTVGGRFLDYWQQNGGLAVFGYPISPRIEEDGRAVQYFERQRFEEHPGNQPPYDVLLGRIGAEALAARGVDWQMRPLAQPAPGCLYIDATHHNICNQHATGGFLSYWLTHGLSHDGDPAVRAAERLALFGYPLTEAYLETNSSGDTVLTQWFERARFEWHPDASTTGSGGHVLLGRLGAEMRDRPMP